MDKRQYFLSSIILANSLFINPLSATIQYNWGPNFEGYTNLEIAIDGSYGATYIRPSPRLFEATVTFDWEEPSVLYNLLDLSWQGGTIRFSEDLTAGPGVSKRIETILSVDPISIRTSNLGPIELISYTGKKYRSKDYIYTGEGAIGFNNLIFSGSYKVVGPTESVSGIFSIELEPVHVALNYTVHTANYPSEVILTRDWGWGDVKYYFLNSDYLNADTSIVDVIVDGGHVDLHLTKSGIQCEFPYIIPEPATYLAFGLGGLALLRKRRTK